VKKNKKIINAHKFYNEAMEEKLHYLPRPSTIGSSQDLRASSPRAMSSRILKDIAIVVEENNILSVSAPTPRKEVTMIDKRG
jgi:hypothetical protein